MTARRALILLLPAESNAFAARRRLHHKPGADYNFNLGAVVDGQLFVVAIFGRPVSRDAPTARKHYRPEQFEKGIALRSGGRGV